MIRVDTSNVPKINGKRNYTIGLTLPYSVDDREYGNVIITNIENNLLTIKHELGTYTVTTKYVCSFLPIAISQPNIAKLFVHEEDKWKYSRNSKATISCICPECNKINNKKITNLITNNRLRCSFCGDGLSFPFKFVSNVMSELQEHYEFYMSFEECYDWCKYVNSNKIKKTGRYDIYFKYNNKKYLIEVDGDWHRKDNNLSGQTVEQSKEIDEWKDRLAKENNFTLIRINAEKSSVPIMIKNIKNSILAELFDLSLVNFDRCEGLAAKSFALKAAQEWNSGIFSTEEIGNKLGFSRHTIRTWLKQVAKINLCDYSVEKARAYSAQKTIATLRANRKKVVCVNEPSIIWDSYEDCMKELGLSKSAVLNMCLHYKPSLSKYKDTEEPLYLMYLEDYEKNGNMYQYYKDQQEGFVGSTTYHRERKCICLNDRNKFVSCKVAGEYYGEAPETIRAICNKQTYATKDNKVFVYYEDYLEMTEEEIEECLNFVRGSTAKTVICINTLTEYPSLTEAGMAVGISVSKISRAISENTFAGYETEYEIGYMWQFKKDYSPNNKIILPHTKALIRLDDNMIYPLMKNVMQLYGIKSHKNFIKDCCDSQGYYKGSQWQSLSTYFAEHPEIHNQIAFYREHVYLAHEQKEEQENNKNEQSKTQQ